MEDDYKKTINKLLQTNTKIPVSDVVAATLSVLEDLEQALKTDKSIDEENIETVLHAFKYVALNFSIGYMYLLKEIVKENTVSTKKEENLA